ncbi:hypothetical protein DY000_02039547 [Brassica cretica]|uniref:Uncharacterized protein n=1 Tax=Brassica cretica TaxID=69181 RepID=A0ABQ7BMG0_BRACR|nr:hypothetical protein DY000_02039547 [Brassica cretica]
MFWSLISGSLILCLEMCETSVLGLGQDLVCDRLSDYMTQIPRQLVDYIMAKSYEQHEFRELSGADEADIDKEITMEEFLKLEDEAQPGD